MKRLTAIVLLVLLLCGCSTQKYRTEKVTFYYPRAELIYGAEDGVLAPETRTLSGSLAALLSVYLRGPEDPALIAPCPAGTQLKSAVWNNKTLTLFFTEEFSLPDSIDRTVSCAAIAKTCFSLSTAEAVCIQTAATEDVAAYSITFTREDILLFDEIPSEDPSDAT